MSICTLTKGQRIGTLPGDGAISPTCKLHDLGQSDWLDNITRDLLTRWTLRYDIDETSVTGLTSNHTIFGHAMGNGFLSSKVQLSPGFNTIVRPTI